jgi:hypothetical protein
MSIVTNLLMQNYATALQQIDNLEKGATKAIEDFKGLKSGELSLDDLVVTDNGWEFLPKPPFESSPESNGAAAKEKVTA